jgi:hypothetical protein
MVACQQPVARVRPGRGPRRAAPVGLWTDATGKRRRTELVALGAASSIDTALQLALAGMQQHPEGTRGHRRYTDWHRRLKAAEWAMVRCENRYRAMVAALSGGMPVWDGHGDGDDDVPPIPPAAPGARPLPLPIAAE